MELLTIGEAAAMLRVSAITIRRYVADGRLSAVRVGRRLRVERRAVEAFATPVAANRQEPSAEGFVVQPPTPEQLTRRKALVEEILRNSKQRNIAPLTSAELVDMARVEELQKYGWR